MLPRLLLDVLVQAVAVGIHRDDRGKILDRQVPHRFGRAELQQRYAVDALDRARVELRRAADGVQIHRAVLLHRGQRLRAHAALADDRAHAVAPDDLALIRLFADARRRTGGRHPPDLAFLHDHRTAVIQDRATQIDRRIVLHQVRVHRIAAGKHRARQQHDVAHAQ